MSILTDQVEAQGEKIRDLESSLEEHRQKLSSTEEMLQQVTHTHTHTRTDAGTDQVFEIKAVIGAHSHMKGVEGRLLNV